MKVQVVTLFPEMLNAVTGFGVTRRAVEQGLLQVDAVNPRDFTQDRHRTVDDRPFGGGPGMVMKIQPLQEAIQAAKARLAEGASAEQRNPKVIYLSPQGRKLDQQAVEELAGEAQLILVAGRYEGIDERLIEAEVDQQWSIGDFVLSGGELPAMVMIDAVSRCLPGVLGHEDSAQQDSFSGSMRSLLDCPHFTRPEEYQGRKVPEVLLGGHHEEIRLWRLKQSLGRTWLLRPDLLEQRRLDPGLTGEEEKLLKEFQREYEESGA